MTNQPPMTNLKIVQDGPNPIHMFFGCPVTLEVFKHIAFYEAELRAARREVEELRANEKRLIDSTIALKATEELLEAARREVAEMRAERNSALEKNEELTITKNRYLADLAAAREAKEELQATIRALQPAFEAARERIRVLEFPRKEVRDFAQAMELELRANDSKPGWKGTDLNTLSRRLRDEADELHCALDDKGGDPFAWAVCVREESADVANFAMMIWDNAAPTTDKTEE